MTIHKTALTLVLIGAAVPHLRADFTYESTSKITGGALVGMLKFAGAFSKDSRKMMDAIPSTTSIKGNRMVHKTADSASIIDLDKETITHVDYAKKTYSVMTFAQMKQAMEEMAQKMQQQKGKAGEPPPDMQFDVKMNDTGQTKTIKGNNAHEVIMTMTMQGSDAKSGAKGGMDVTTDMWIAPKVAGYEEVRDFNRRMSQKIAWSPMANPLINRPDMQRAMSELAKEGSKMDGLPVLETIKMGGKIEGMPDSSSSQSQSQSSRNSSPPPASVGDALGAALGGRIGLGGFGRKKKEAQPDPGANSSANANDAASNSASGSLMEMTREVTNFSSSAADPSLFEVPSGFTQVQEDPMRPGRRQK
ncbi:MAG: hypothetical protein M3Z36_13540 [Acidobacteriota bacterium]|nr:hypothetical protein [Acidobacteriota bacterium]